MQDLREAILKASVRVFMRYGVGRTRMADIASEAGIVRQTVYSFFKNKDEVLCAAIRHFSAASLAEIRRGWETDQTLADKLDTFYKHAIISSYEVISATPDARDMIGGFNEKGKTEVVRAQALKIAAWTETLADHCGAAKGGLTDDDLAKYIVLASLGLRDQAASIAQLRSLLETQKSGILALVDR